MISIAATRHAAAGAATLLLVTVFTGSNDLHAQVYQNERVSASLVADVNSITAGQRFRLGVKLEMQAGWHVNWINPGDAGLAPTIAWRLPEGFSAGMLSWPHPGHFPAGPLTILGYGGSVLLWADVTAPTTLSPGQELQLAADVGWLACREVCIPGEASLGLELRASVESSPSGDAALFEDAARRVPGVPQSWQVHGWYQDDDTMVIELECSGASALEGVYLYPYEPGVVDYSRPQELSQLEVAGNRGGYRLSIARDRTLASAPTRLRAVIVAASGWGGDGTSIEVEIPMEPGPR